MKSSTFGMVAATAVASLIGSVMLVTSAGAEDAKACYRKHCGKSVQGHEGSCGGTKAGDVKDQAECEKAGGAWVTEAEAAKFATMK
jgi:uncharacterized low-complexity protein